MRYKYINQKRWAKILKKPDWYLKLKKPITEFILNIREKDRVWKQTREEIFNIIYTAYKEDKIAFGKSGKNWDEERMPIEYIVLHHTSRPGNAPLGFISAMQIVRQYAPVYWNRDDKECFGKPIWSNHFRKNKMVFFPYHWLIRPDGRAIRLLEDSTIGWHAGKWDINCKSIAICFSGDFENKIPKKSMLDAAVKIIKKNYPYVLKQNILGHGEVKSGRTCPGKYLGHIKKYILERV